MVSLTSLVNIHTGCICQLIRIENGIHVLVDYKDEERINEILESI